MEQIETKIINVIAGLGWALVGFGALFTIWAFALAIKSSESQLGGILIVFFIALIFCSIAVGLFFVVSSIIVKSLKRIEKNTSKEIEDA